MLDQSGCGRDRSGNTDADGGPPAGVGIDAINEILDRMESAPVVALRSRNACPCLLGAGIIQHDSFHFGAAEIDSDAHAADV